jgi:hypothetical protein
MQSSQSGRTFFNLTCATLVMSVPTVVIFVIDDRLCPYGKSVDHVLITAQCNALYLASLGTLLLSTLTLPVLGSWSGFLGMKGIFKDRIRSKTWTVMTVYVLLLGAIGLGVWAMYLWVSW